MKKTLSIIFATFILSMTPTYQVADAWAIGRYTSYTSLIPEYPLYGNASFYLSAGHTPETFPVTNNILSPKSVQLPMYVTICYRFSKGISLKIEEIGDMFYVPPGEFKARFYTLPIKNTTYETAATDLLHTGRPGTDYMVNRTDYNGTVKSNYEGANAILKQYGVVDTHPLIRSMELPFGAPNAYYEWGTYQRFEYRGIFYAANVQTYQIHYQKVNVKHHGLPGPLGYDTWEWAISEYGLNENIIIYVYLPDSLTLGFNLYAPLNGYQYYNGTRDPNIFYPSYIW